MILSPFSGGWAAKGKRRVMRSRGEEEKGRDGGGAPIVSIFERPCQHFYVFVFLTIDLYGRPLIVTLLKALAKAE